VIGSPGGYGGTVISSLGYAYEGTNDVITVRVMGWVLRGLIVMHVLSGL
jgi:hypothetical protein